MSGRNFYWEFTGNIFTGNILELISYMTFKKNLQISKYTKNYGFQVNIALLSTCSLKTTEMFHN